MYENGILNGIFGILADGFVGGLAAAIYGFLATTLNSLLGGFITLPTDLPE